MQNCLFTVATSLMMLSACTFASEPNDQEMRNAYRENDDVRLGSEFLSGNLSLSEFRKFDCVEEGSGMYRCKFYSKFSAQHDRSGGQKILSHIIGSQTGFIREALFFKNSDGKWLCTEVISIQQ